MTANSISQIATTYTVYNGKTENNKTENTSSVFEGIMSSNISKQIGCEAPQKAQSVKTSSKQTDTNKTDDSKDKAVDDKQIDKSTDKTTNKSADKASDNQTEKKEKACKDSDVEDEDFEDSVKKAGQAIIDLFTKDMNIPIEKLNEACEALGVNILSLTNPDIAKEVVMLACNETNLTGALTNEVFADNLETLNSFFDKFDISEQLGMSSEEFDSIVAEAVQRINNKETIEEIVNQQTENTTIIKTDITEATKTVISDDVSALETDNDSKSNNGINQNTELDNNDAMINDTATESISVDSESTESDSSNSRQNDTDEKMMDVSAFSQHLEKTLLVKNGELYAEVAVVKDMREIVNQIVEQIKISVKPDTTTMEMQLNPENLGKVNLHIVSKNGEISAQFIVESQTAKEAIESQLETLKDRFESQGIKVNAVEVSISDYDLSRDGQSDSSQGYNQQESQKGKRRYESSDAENISEIKKEIEEEMQRVNGNSVDFSA